MDTCLNGIALDHHWRVAPHIHAMFYFGDNHSFCRVDGGALLRKCNLKQGRNREDQTRRGSGPGLYVNTLNVVLWEKRKALLVAQTRSEYGPLPKSRFWKPLSTAATATQTYTNGHKVLSSNPLRGTNQFLVLVYILFALSSSSLLHFITLATTHSSFVTSRKGTAFSRFRLSFYPCHFSDPTIRAVLK